MASAFPESEADDEDDDVNHHELVLKLTKDWLMKKLNLESSILVSLLNDNKVISQFEREHIERPHVMSTDQTKQHWQVADNEIQVAELIKVLLRKDREDYIKFCGLLEQTGEVRIRRQLRQTIPEVIHVVQNKLCQYFDACYTEVDMLCLHDQGHKVRLDDIYVPIKTCTIYQDTHAEREKIVLNHYSEIFAQLGEKQRKLILIQGKPMSGKTTFLKKVACDWVDALKNNTNPWMKPYSIVIPVLLRLITTESTLMQVIKSQLDCVKQELDIINWLLQEKHTLLVLDGLDELNAHMWTDFSDTLTGIIYPKCTILVTSRAEGTDKLEVLKVTPKVQGILEGFGEAEISLYVEKRYIGHPQVDPSVLIKFLLDSYPNGEKKNKNLYEICTEPGQLGMVTLLYERQKDLSNSLVVVYTNILMLVLELAYQRNVWGQQNRDILVDCKEVLTKFGKLALERDNDGNMDTVFTWQQINDVVGKEALSYGLLYKSHPLASYHHSQYSFLHKSIQEWLAGYFIAHNPAPTLEYRDIVHIRSDTLLHQFIMSMFPAAMEQIATTAIHQCASRQLERPDNQIICLLKWMNDVNLPTSVLQPLAGSTLAHQVTWLFLLSIPVHGRMRVVSALLHMLPRCGEINMGDCQLTGEDLQELIDSLHQPVPQVEVLYLSVNCLSGCEQQVASLLDLLPGCTRCDIYNTDLNKEVLTQLKPGVRFT